MRLFVQYHNVDREGLPLALPAFTTTRIGIRTRQPHVQRADGRVFLIAGIGKPRRYYLWETFLIEEVAKTSAGEFEAWGTGWQLAPPQQLHGSAFDAFRRACANLIGFREITDLPFARTLLRSAEEHRPPGDFEENAGFLYGVRALLKAEPLIQSVDVALADLVDAQQPTRALSIRQPHAEAILRGVKPVENRTKATNVRGRVYIYAGLARDSAAEEAASMRKYGITDVTCDELPRGVVVGTVELYACNGGEWSVRNPQRAGRLIRPKGQPQPVWFYPF